MIILKTRLQSHSKLKYILVISVKIIEEILQKQFFARHSNLVAPDLIGCSLIRINNRKEILKGIIVETEAYSQEEESCHGFNKKTNSNQVLFGEPGKIYVYRSYGLHYCLNIVTDKMDFASGVLIRSIFIENQPERIAAGPGLLSKKFLINSKFNDLKIYDNNLLKISKRSKKFKAAELVQTKRVGISKAINLKWRWYLKQSRSISKREKGDKNPPLEYYSSNKSSI